MINSMTKNVSQFVRLIVKECVVPKYFYAFYIFYLFVVDKGVSLAPMYPSIVVRKSDLRSSLRTKCWLTCFYPFFCKIYFD